MSIELRPRATVVICAFTEQRWGLLQRAVVSVVEQTARPLEVIVCIDHNRSLYERVQLWLKEDPALACFGE